MRENKRKHSEEVLALYKSLRKTILLMLTTVFTLVVVTVAWFANNSSVNSLLSSISASDKVSFELASVGDVASLGGTLPGEYEGVERGNDYNISGSVTGKWTKGTQTIQWNMNNQSNLNNYVTQDNSEIQNDGLSPGAHGQIQFYVIPTEIGKLSGKFNLEIVPLKEPTGSEQSEWIEIEDETALRLLRGHLLFYYSNQGNETEQITLVDYLNGEFTLDFGTVSTTDPILVILNWFWPQTLNDAKHGVISSKETNENLGKMLSAAMTDNPASFFYRGENQVVLETDDDFNNADKYIGDTIDAIILRLNADQAS